MKEFLLTGHEEGVITSVGSLTGNLAELIGAMMASRRSLIVVAEFSDHRYVQFLVRPDEGVFGEVISNLNIGDHVALSGDDEQMLRRIGFFEPSHGANPNWWFRAVDAKSLPRLMWMMNQVIRDVLMEKETNKVEVRSWPAQVPDSMETAEFRSLCRVYLEENRA